MASAKDYALAFARVTLGASTLLHGVAETFGVWGGPTLGATTADMAQKAAVSPDTIHYVVAIAMMAAGLLLLLGLVVRAGCIAVVVITIWFGIVDHRFDAFFDRSGGCEHLLAVAALCAVVATHGPGALKLDLKRKQQK